MLGTYVLSAGYQDAYYKHAQKVRTLIIQKYREAFGHCDIIATPATPGPAFEIDGVQDPLQMYQEDLYTIGANLGGLPSISVPMGFSVEGLPLGMMLTGPQKEDVQVCRIANLFEQETKYTEEIPNL